MKLKMVWIIFFFGVVSLLIFQSIWLYSTFLLKKEELTRSVNQELKKAIEEEVYLRVQKHSSDQEKQDEYQDSIKKEEVRIEIDDEEEALEAGVFQLVMKHSGYPFNINALDSIFYESLIKNSLQIDYFLIYKDSTGMILEQTGITPSSKIDKMDHTDSLLIVDGKRVQAILHITFFVVFKQMVWLLVASFLMSLIITYCIYYQAKTLFTQYKLNRLRDDFTNALTHDMKTPLGTINVVLAQFRSGALNNNPEMREKFGAIAMDQVSSLLMLVEKILTIAKLEHRKLAPEYMEADIPQMVKELSERFSLSKNKKVEILSFFDLEDRTIRLDPTLIKDAVGNLIENSVKYSGDGVKIWVDCYIKNEKLFIRVRDNGFGIPEEGREKIFEKFERGIAVERKGAKGFGLGLNYVKRVAEAHSGIVTLFSTEGEGSEFTMVLPLK